MCTCKVFLPMPFAKQLTKEQAFQKLKHYCGYQERSHIEVKEKLYSFKLRKTEVEELISKLIEEDYLNEVRYAEHFARGKFRIKQWGRVKIKYELQQKRVSEYCIKNAMKVIDEDAYLKILQKLFDAKLKTLKSETNHFTRKRKLQDYLLQKGYEYNLIHQLLQKDS